MNNIKNKILRRGIWLFLVGLLTACDRGFVEMNKNPNAYTDPVIGNLFSTSIIRTGGTSTFDTYWGNMIYIGGYMQLYATLNTIWPGDKYLHTPESGAYFETAYSSHLKNIEQIIAMVKDDPESVNQYQIARIWRVYIMHRITDLYGDIPYSQAGKGYLDGTLAPAYDRQSDIYPDMLRTLEESAASLDASKLSYGAADFLYNGDIVGWKKFAYSLMLRLGMRLTKVDPAMAEEYVKKALAGGVMERNEDMALLPHSGETGDNWHWGNERHQSFVMGRQGLGPAKLPETFIKHLQTTNDPRLPFYSSLWYGNDDPSRAAESTNPSIQMGLPNGYDETSITTRFPNYNSELYALFSETNFNTIGSKSAPNIFMSYTEVELLRAEAVLRGWDTGDANEHFTNAVISSMELTTVYPGGIIIPRSSIDAYVAENHLSGTTAQQLEQIHTQFWVTHFMFTDYIEIYANWRRTGYPVLIPVNYPGNETGGTIPRRLRYPESEQSLNRENYSDALQMQGPDLYTTRVWWDAE